MTSWNWTYNEVKEFLIKVNLNNVDTTDKKAEEQKIMVDIFYGLYSQFRSKVETAINLKKLEDLDRKKEDFSFLEERLKKKK